MDQSLLNSLKQILNPISSTYNPELIYSITWQNLKESATSEQVLKFFILNFIEKFKKLINFFREQRFNSSLQLPSLNRLHMPFSTILK